MNQYTTAKVEACLELAKGKTPEILAADFKNKVMKVTGFTKSGFDLQPLCQCSYERLLKGDSANQILSELFN